MAHGGPMAIKDCLGIAADFASIATAIVAVWAYGKFKYLLHRRRVDLEQYLKSEKDKKTDHGQRTLLHLSRELKMSQSEIFEAAIQSENIELLVEKDSRGKAKRLLLEYKNEGNQK
jgi:hypothetical protein